jgi:hypothetical protein
LFVDVSGLLLIFSLFSRNDSTSANILLDVNNVQPRVTEPNQTHDEFHSTIEKELDVTENFEEKTKLLVSKEVPEGMEGELKVFFTQFTISFTRNPMSFPPASFAWHFFLSFLNCTAF